MCRGVVASSTRMNGYSDVEEGNGGAREGGLLAEARRLQPSDYFFCPLDREEQGFRVLASRQGEAFSLKLWWWCARGERWRPHAAALKIGNSRNSSPPPPLRRSTTSVS